MPGLAEAVVLGNKIIGAQNSIKSNIDRANRNLAKWGSKQKFKPKVKQDEYSKKVMKVMGLNK